MHIGPSFDGIYCRSWMMEFVSFGEKLPLHNPIHIIFAINLLFISNIFENRQDEFE